MAARRSGQRAEDRATDHAEDHGSIGLGDERAGQAEQRAHARSQHPARDGRRPTQKGMSSPIENRFTKAAVNATGLWGNFMVSIDATVSAPKISPDTVPCKSEDMLGRGAGL